MYIAVHDIVKKYTADYDKALIFNKVHHELNQVPRDPSLLAHDTIHVLFIFLALLYVHVHVLHVIFTPVISSAVLILSMRSILNFLVSTFPDYMYNLAVLTSP